MGHDGPALRPHSGVGGPLREATERLANLRDIDSVDRVQRQGRWNLDDVKHCDVRVLDSRDQRTEVDERGVREVIDGSEDVVLFLRDGNEGFDDRGRRLRDLLPAGPEVVHTESEYGPPESDEPSEGLDEVQRDGEDRFAAQADDREEGE